MKANARVVPVCPKCGEDLEAMLIRTSREAAEGDMSAVGRGSYLVWVCGCSDLEEGLDRSAEYMVEKFIEEAPQLYAGVETMEDVDTDIYWEVQNVLDGLRDFAAWLTNREYLEERLREREETRQRADGRRSTWM